MLKKLISILLIGLVFFQSTALAEFNYSEIKKSLSNNDGFSLYENEENKSAIIYRDAFSIADRSFEHKDASEGYYSYFENDWLVLGYDDQALPLRRLRLYFASKKPQNIRSLSFSFNGNVYTFSEFFDSSRDITQYKNGEYCQNIVLIFDSESKCFLDDINRYINTLDKISYDAVMGLKPVKMVMHGNEDIEIVLPNTFLWDCALTELLIPDQETYDKLFGMTDSPTGFKFGSEQKTQSSNSQVSNSQSANSQSANSNILILGENGEFAIKKKEAYIYNTPASNLTGYETTDKYLFENMDDVVCIVHSNTNSAIISYYPAENNSALTPWQLIERCFEANFGENAGIFDGSFTYKRVKGQIRISSVDDSGNNKVYYEYSFIVLEHGIICIASNSTDEGIDAFVSELFGTIMAKPGNLFVLN